MAHLQQVRRHTTPASSLAGLRSLLGGRLDVANSNWVLERIMGGSGFCNIVSAMGNTATFQDQHRVLQTNPSTNVQVLLNLLTQ